MVKIFHGHLISLMDSIAKLNGQRNIKGLQYICINLHMTHYHDVSGQRHAGLQRSTSLNSAASGSSTAPQQGQPQLLGMNEIRQKLDIVTDMVMDRNATQTDMLAKYLNRADNERMSFALWVHSGANNLDPGLYSDFSKAIGDIMHTFQTKQHVINEQRAQRRNLEPQPGTSEPSNLTHESQSAHTTDNAEDMSTIKTVKNLKAARVVASLNRAQLNMPSEASDSEVGK